MLPRLALTAALAMGAVPSASAEVDTCLVGTWQANTQVFADTLVGVLGGGTAEVTHGALVMTVEDSGAMQFAAHDLAISYTVPGMPSVTLHLNGGSAHRLSARGNAYWMERVSYALDATADVRGEVIAIPISGGTQARSPGLFTCSEAELAFETDASGSQLPRLWRRVGQDSL